MNIILLSEENLHIVNVLQIAQECGSRLRHENGRKSPRRRWLIETLGTLEKHNHFVVVGVGKHVEHPGAGGLKLRHVGEVFRE